MIAKLQRFFHAALYSPVVTALMLLPVLFFPSGCAPLGSQDAAEQAGKDYAGKAADAAGAAGQKAQDVAVHDPHLVAAAIVALVGAALVKRLWSSAPFRYLLVAAAAAWIAYAAGQAAR